MVVNASAGADFASVLKVRVSARTRANGKAELFGRHRRGRGRTIVWLRPGLTGAQRKAALRRLRQEASRGHGPSLPLPQLTVALGLDRVRSGYRNATSVIRLHPAGSLLPAIVTGFAHLR